MTVKPGWARKRHRLRRREADRAPANTTDVARAGQTGSPWALSAAEWRLLVITFVGGLGSIVAAACVIGGAIAIARHEKSSGPGLVQLTVIAASVLVALLLILKFTARPNDRVSMWLRWASIAVLSLTVVVGLLTWIGVAAGVK